MVRCPSAEIDASRTHCEPPPEIRRVSIARTLSWPPPTLGSRLPR
ncbi:pollen-specific leucine-rich repeat extensin-like protein 4 [Iris pallida]|uniref:Pollen-specific leucine-rich repeat extensin-like protein 4 n=1 Tax=Iris pallida TaxID=29817 RepID=A0AAX6GCH9_IRIPA|nr:pollen-specific leucine-rich repeat extensin-like protein 4 [Iris pallida]KAJ6826163.1 pollen-specific leucine-rich repeat extensin-like protein 4 [Iris pallida]